MNNIEWMNSWKCISEKIKVKELFRVSDKLEIEFDDEVIHWAQEKDWWMEKKKECCVSMIQFSKKYHLTIMNVQIISH